MFNEPFLNASAVGAIAVPDKTPVPITVDKTAMQWSRSCQELVQGLGSAAPAWIIEALRVVAVLPALWRIDAVETNPLACNLDRVAIDHRRSAFHWAKQWFCPVCNRALEASSALLAGGALDRELSDCCGKRGDAEEDQPQERSRETP
ncbi:hypothetical protein [Mesorhizobium mediterraneum]|uniref:hypothetical protein n=1 Tax=Mesorhizobium mediterraneum TaxID=43617 RepID=UPI001FED7D0B|nr:hypothetical protein [Mesorhizobium mediterraneum]